MSVLSLLNNLMNPCWIQAFILGGKILTLNSSVYVMKLYNSINSINTHLVWKGRRRSLGYWAHRLGHWQRRRWQDRFKGACTTTSSRSNWTHTDVTESINQSKFNNTIKYYFILPSAVQLLTKAVDVKSLHIHKQIRTSVFLTRKCNAPD